MRGRTRSAGRTACGLAAAGALLLTPLHSQAATSCSDSAAQEAPCADAAHALHQRSRILATPVVIGAAQPQARVTAIEVTSRELNAGSGSGTLRFYRGVPSFDAFGDPNWSELGPPDVYRARFESVGPSIRRPGRRLYSVRLDDPDLAGRVYWVASAKPGAGGRLLVLPEGAPPLVAPERRRQGVPESIDLFESRVSGIDVFELEPVAPVPTANDVPLPSRVSFSSERFVDAPRDTALPRDGSEQPFGFVRVEGELSGELRVVHDRNYVGLSDFGDSLMTSAVGFGGTLKRARRRLESDPLGAGRRIFDLVPVEDRAEPGPAKRHAAPPYTQVLAATARGQHRLVVRREGRIAHVLPLHERRTERHLAALDALVPSEQAVLREIWSRTESAERAEVESGHLVALGLSQSDHLAWALSRLPGFPQLRSLSVDGGRDLPQGALDPIAKLQQLEELALYETRITNADLQIVGALQKLEALDVAWEREPGVRSVVAVTDAGVAPLGELRSLNFLRLSGPGITDAAVPHLFGLPHLEDVAFVETRVSAAGAVALLERAPEAEIAVWGTPEPGMDCPLIAHVSAFGVELSGCVDDALLAALSRFQSIRSLSIDTTGESDDAGEGRITDAGLRALARLESLEELFLGGPLRVTAAGLRSLEALPNLREFAID